MAFGFSEENLPAELFLQEGNVITFGVPPTRVDLLNRIDGVSFEIAASTTVRGRYGSQEVSFIGRDMLIQNKLSTDRLQDKADAEALERQGA